MRSRLAAALAALTLLPSSTLFSSTPAAASASAMQPVSRFNTSTIQPGEQASFQVDVARYPGAVPEVGLLPFGASTAKECVFHLVRTWYDQRRGNGRDFRFTIANVGEIACAAEVLVGAVQAFRTWPTRIEAGTQRSWRWNNANPLNAVHMAGVTPRGTSQTRDCQIQITRTWYVQQPNGEREFHLTARNTGSTSCDADIMLARKNNNWLPPTGEPTGRLSPGAVSTYYFVPGSAVEQDNVIVPGIVPWGPENERPCRLEIVRREFVQDRISSSGHSRRSLKFQLKNTGSTTCGRHDLFTYVPLT